MAAPSAGNHRPQGHKRGTLGHFDTRPPRGGERAVTARRTAARNGPPPPALDPLPPSPGPGVDMSWSGGVLGGRLPRALIAVRFV